jgi:hypothetical protein
METDDKIYQGPDGTALRFYTQPTKNNFQSEKHGRPIFDTSLMVEVMVPGSRESTPQFEVERVYCEEVGLDKKTGERIHERSEKYELYLVQINAFKANSGEGLTEGTPIGQWGQVDAGTAASLRAVGIFTVEQLASISDGNLTNVGMGARVLREQAQAFLQTRQFGIPTAAMAAENANLKSETERLHQRIEELLAINKTLELSAANPSTPMTQMFADTAASLGETLPPPPAPAAPMFEKAEPKGKGKTI